MSEKPDMSTFEMVGYLFAITLFSFLIGVGFELGRILVSHLFR